MHCAHLGRVRDRAKAIAMSARMAVVAVAAASIACASSAVVAVAATVPKLAVDVAQDGSMVVSI